MRRTTRKPRVKRVVEFGSGSNELFRGRVLGRLVRHSERSKKPVLYVAFDIGTQKPARFSHGLVRGFYMFGDIRKIHYPLQNNSVHEIHIHMVTSPPAEGMENFRKWVDEIHRVLSPKGRLYLSFDHLFIDTESTKSTKPLKSLEMLVEDKRFKVRFGRISPRAFLLASNGSIFEKWWMKKPDQKPAFHVAKFSDGGGLNTLGFIVLQKK